MKLLVLAMMFLTSLNSAIPFSFDNVAKSNQDVIINETGNKVQLRQKAIKKANNADDANIETTNVDYDLRYLYGGEKGYLNYNIWDLLPTENNSKDTSYKFLCAKPVGTNLYLYVYDVDNRNGDILNATFRISKSKTQNVETGLFEEQFVTYSARFINSYGYKQRFMKFAIDNIVNLENDVRMFIDSGSITYQDTSTSKRYFKNLPNIENEFAFNVGGENDFIGEYFQNDYVKIVDGEVSLLITNKNTTSSKNDNFYIGYEDFYYFFNTDRKIDDLIEVQYDYQLQSYTVEYFTPGVDHPGMGGSYYQFQHIYTGLFNDFDKSKNDDREIYGFVDNGIEMFANQSVKKSTKVVDLERSSFLWWKKQVKVNFDNIINCLNIEDLTSDEYKTLKKFVTDVNNSRVQNNKTPYSWAFNLKQTLRQVTKTEIKDTGFLGLGGKIHAYCDCHEVKQSLITWLKFRTNNVEFEFNVLDVPKDTTSVYLAYVPYKTLGDIILEKTINAWDWFKSIFTGVVRNIVPILISVAVIMIIVLCWPVLSSTMQLVGAGIKSANYKIENKSKKKKKGKTKKKGN